MARFQLERGPIPLHHQVFRDLKAALDTSEWRPGDRMPTERELAERYGCSLITIRHALGELVREGRIERTRGRGTFVLPPRIERDIGGTMSFAEEMRRRGLDPATRVITARIETAGEVVAAHLGIAPGRPCRPSRTRSTRQRRAAAARAGAAARGAVPGPAGLRLRTTIAVRHPGRSLQHAHRPRSRVGGAGGAPPSRGGAPGGPEPLAGAADRRHRLRRERGGRGDGTELRAGRPHEVLPRARRSFAPIGSAMSTASRRPSPESADGSQPARTGRRRGAAERSRRTGGSIGFGGLTMRSTVSRIGCTARDPGADPCRLWRHGRRVAGPGQQRRCLGGRRRQRGRQRRARRDQLVLLPGRGRRPGRRWKSSRRSSTRSTSRTQHHVMLEVVEYEEAYDTLAVQLDCGGSARHRRAGRGQRCRSLPGPVAGPQPTRRVDGLRPVAVLGGLGRLLPQRGVGHESACPSPSSRRCSTTSATCSTRPTSSTRRTPTVSRTCSTARRSRGTSTRCASSRCG